MRLPSRQASSEKHKGNALLILTPDSVHDTQGKQADAQWHEQAGGCKSMTRMWLIQSKAGVAVEPGI